MTTIAWKTPLLPTRTVQQQEDIMTLLLEASNDTKKDNENQEDISVVSVPCRGWYGLCFGGAEESRRECTCSHVAWIQPPQRKNPSTFNLPFVEEKSIAVTSVDIGKLLFFEKNTVVSVTSTSRKEDSCCCQWRLVLQHVVQHDTETSNNNKTVPLRRPLMCVLCKRRFDTVSSIQRHCDATHNRTESGRTTSTMMVPQRPSWFTRPLPVVYQDDALAVVMKPQGAPVMGDKPSLCRSDMFLALAAKNGLRKPVPVHRLDAATGGLLVLAKTKHAEAALKRSFATKACRKRYRALVVGQLEPNEGTIAEPISKKNAVTNYRVVQHIPCSLWNGMSYVTIIDLFPVTGRKHQLRKHARFLGHPIWGDKRYGRPPINEQQPQEVADDDVENVVERDPYAYMCLWAMEIAFPHPNTGLETVVSMKKEPLWLQALVQYIQKKES